jgi:uncharacterized protein
MAGASPRPSPASSTAPAPAVRTVPVAGMTCRTCERRIERNVRRIPGVEHVVASAVRGRVEITAAGPIPDAAVREAIQAAGYEIGRSPWVSADPRVWGTLAAGLLVVALAAVALRVTGIGELAPGAEEIADGGLIVALLLGLAAGVSTCLALTGGLVLALSAAFAARADAPADAGTWERLRPVSVFLLGRIAGFALLGALLGAIGASITMPPALTAALMLGVAILMTLLGIRLTGVSPRVAAWSPTLPGSLARALGADERGVTKYSDTRAAALGVATFFLPCGFTQAVQVYALSTGSPLTAGAIMALFALGTAPGLLALGGLPGLIPAGSRPAFSRVVGVVVLAFALVNGTAGLRLAGFSTVAASAPAAGITPVITMDGDVQVLRTFQIATGYMPEDAALYAGRPTRWIIESLEGASCAIFVQVPALDLAFTLNKGENAINLPPLPVGRIPYTCSMGMYGGTLTVVEPPADPAGPPAG